MNPFEAFASLVKVGAAALEEYQRTRALDEAASVAKYHRTMAAEIAASLSAEAHGAEVRSAADARAAEIRARMDDEVGIPFRTIDPPRDDP